MIATGFRYVHLFKQVRNCKEEKEAAPLAAIYDRKFTMCRWTCECHYGQNRIKGQTSVKHKSSETYNPINPRDCAFTILQALTSWRQSGWKYKLPILVVMPVIPGFAYGPLVFELVDQE